MRAVRAVQVSQFCVLLQLLVVAAIILSFKFYCKFYCSCDASLSTAVCRRDSVCLCRVLLKACGTWVHSVTHSPRQWSVWSVVVSGQYDTNPLCHSLTSPSESYISTGPFVRQITQRRRCSYDTNNYCELASYRLMHLCAISPLTANDHPTPPPGNRYPHQNLLPDTLLVSHSLTHSDK